MSQLNVNSVCNKWCVTRCERKREENSLILFIFSFHFLYGKKKKKKEEEGSKRRIWLLLSSFFIIHHLDLQEANMEQEKENYSFFFSISSFSLSCFFSLLFSFICFLLSPRESPLIMIHREICSLRNFHFFRERKEIVEKKERRMRERRRW